MQVKKNCYSLLINGLKLHLEGSQPNKLCLDIIISFSTFC